MSSVGTELAQIAEIEIPGMSDDFPDVCSIVAVAPTSDGAGGYTQGTVTNVYTSVPCVYESLSGAKFDAVGKLLSTHAYRITMPIYHSGSRVNLDPVSHRIIVATRGNEPAKTFRILSVGDAVGVIYQVLCEKEN